MKKIERRRTNKETFDIEGEKFEADTSVKKIKEAVLKGHKLQQIGKEIEEMSFDSSEEEILKTIEEMEKAVEEATNFVFGEGAFEKLYKMADEDIYIVADWLFQVVDHLYDKHQAEEEKRVAKYTKKKR